MDVICGFENLNQKFESIISSNEWKKLIDDFKNSDNIYLIGNGGNWAVCNHGACDMNRLFSKNNINKNIESLDSQSLITSISNDYGYNHLYMKWIKGKINFDKDKKNMIIGISSSGNSKNILTPLYYAKQEGIKCCLISGTKSNAIDENINEVVINTNYFHTAEVVTLMLFYQMIHSCDAECPNIREEIIRKGVAQPITRNI